MTWAGMNEETLFLLPLELVQATITELPRAIRTIGCIQRVDASRDLAYIAPPPRDNETYRKLRATKTVHGEAIVLMDTILLNLAELAEGALVMIFGDYEQYTPPTNEGAFTYPGTNPIMHTHIVRARIAKPMSPDFDVELFYKALMAARDKSLSQPGTLE